MELMPRGELTYQRGEIRWISLNPTVGAEAQKTRPCLIIQNNIINQYGLLTIVVPFLPGIKKAPYAVNISPTPKNGLDQPRYLDIGQIRSIDHSRVGNLLGKLDDRYWQEIKIALDIVTGFSL